MQGLPLRPLVTELPQDDAPADRQTDGQADRQTDELPGAAGTRQDGRCPFGKHPSMQRTKQLP